MNYHQEHLATYKNQLHPWCIIRLHPNMREAKLSPRASQLIVRLRRRQDAEAHLQILREKNPGASYDIVFDVTSQYSNSTVRQELF
ncbi:MAG TPA: hypothetical protein DCE56_39400 [Cyanobacteria bacterium UBA8553]|nr:hypothetical protein [Cyanobacteria bacterium UBA8553]HAJ64438.1 hypothetical protein [Cyanobacteria bacterium UBA8543]